MPYDDIGVVSVPKKPEEYTSYVICKKNAKDDLKYWVGGSWHSHPISDMVRKYNFNAGMAECFKLKNQGTYGEVKLVKLTTTVEDVEASIT